MNRKELFDLEFSPRFIKAFPADPKNTVEPRQVSGVCYSKVLPTPVSQPELLSYSRPLGEELGLEPLRLGPSQEARLLSGNIIAPGSEPYATCYGGHQFGHWAGQLGDGRAIYLGEMQASNGKRWEWQLKGAGRTPYSRRGDGRAVLRSSLREYVASEAMQGLGVPTTRALSLVLSGDKIWRDMFYDGHAEQEKGAIVCRLAPSFIRFGHFEIHRAREELDLLKRLADAVIENYFPDIDRKNPRCYQLWLQEVARQTAELVSHWMRVGFVHGVLNSDNMSILSLTIDYGPFAFMDAYDPDWTPNTTDNERRRYAYGRQPLIALWNLERLAQAIQPLLVSAEGMAEMVQCYESSYERSILNSWRQKLGCLELASDELIAIVKSLDAALRSAECDMTLFFRRLATCLSGDSCSSFFDKVKSSFYQSNLTPSAEQLWQKFWTLYEPRLRQDEKGRMIRQELMQAANPCFIPRNYLLQLAIEEIEQEGTSKKLEALMQRLQSPYQALDEDPLSDALRPEWARHKAGCSALSCSS